FIITAASEIMAILSLATSLQDLKLRLSNILIGYNKKGEEVYAKDLNIIDTLVVILKDALMPNLVQTLENTPVFVHGGPFANIAHGCNSILATKMALKLSDYTLTEAGFGADLGAEKFIDIKTRILGKNPDVIVLVSTIRALKYHGFIDQGKDEFEALKAGIINISKHALNLKKFNVPYVLVINNFESDTLEEINYLINWAKENNHPISFVNSFTKGSIGAVDIAEKIVYLAEKPSELNRVYNLEDNLFLKVEKVAKTIYGANGVKYSKKALNKLTTLNERYSNLAICIAKTPLSFSHDPKERAAVSNFDLEISNVRLSRGAGFVVVLTKGIITMPGLPKKPNAEEIFIDEFGIISGKL
ncbi:MAG TPA: formate--tetrahydrofolate ligase, partial [Acholeplasma sp.]|nr:formate--tetrahydrofolate ligase [Acholeplasma sp.]